LPQVDPGVDGGRFQALVTEQIGQSLKIGALLMQKSGEAMALMPLAA
jgi:hypothetical protein